MTTKEVFIVHHSVFHDAFRTDYETPFRKSSKDFFDLLLKHYRESGYKIAYISWEVFEKLQQSEIVKSKAFWIIPTNLVNIDLKANPYSVKLEESIIRLASRKCAKYTPYIVATKPKDKIKQQDTCFEIYTPREAIDFYNKQMRH